ncbi:MAG: FAD-binding oxidoreductase, partial [Dehalococcoidia bacterium]
AVRGGGGNFGVVTSFEYQLYPVGPVLVALLIFPLDEAKEVLQFYHQFASAIPDEINTAAGLASLPDGTPVVAVIACYNGPISEGEKAIEPLKSVGHPMVSEIGPMPYVQVQHLLDDFTPEGEQYYEKSHMMSDVSDAAIDALVDSYARTSSPGNLLVFQQLGNAANRVSPDATAFGHRDARYNLILIACWNDPGESEIHFKWVRDLWDDLLPHATGGTYVNNVGTVADDGTELIRSAYGGNYLRLAEVKRQYDPNNFFRHTQNIQPATS